MTAHSHAQHLVPMHNTPLSSPRFARGGRRILHPRTVLVLFLVAVTIVVALNYLIHGGPDGVAADQPTAALTQNPAQAPPGIWTVSGGGPVK